MKSHGLGTKQDCVGSSITSLLFINDSILYMEENWRGIFVNDKVGEPFALTFADVVSRSGDTVGTLQYHIHCVELVCDTIGIQINLDKSKKKRVVFRNVGPVSKRAMILQRSTSRDCDMLLLLIRRNIYPTVNMDSH